MPSRLYEKWKKREKQRKEGKASAELPEHRRKALEKIAGGSKKKDKPKSKLRDKKKKKDKPKKKLSKHMRKMYSKAQLKAMGYE